MISFLLYREITKKRGTCKFSPINFLQYKIKINTSDTLSIMATIHINRLDWIKKKIIINRTVASDACSSTESFKTKRNTNLETPAAGGKKKCRCSSSSGPHFTCGNSAWRNCKSSREGGQEGVDEVSVPLLQSSLNQTLKMF